MTDLRSVLEAKQISETAYGSALMVHRRAPKGRSKREFFSFNMTKKSGALSFLRDLIPFMRFKRPQALAQYDFLCRAAKGRHVGTGHDAWLCDMSRRMKDDDRSAYDEFARRVRDDLPVSVEPAAWLAGYLDGDGSVSSSLGTKSASVSFCSANRGELDVVSEDIKSLIGVDLSDPHAYRSKLSKRQQWILTISSPAQVTALLAAIEPFMITKRLQARLLIWMRSSRTQESRDQAIHLIHQLNHGVPVEADAHRLLDSSTVVE